MMTDVQNDVDVKEIEVDYKAEFEKLKADFDKVLTKKDELLQEKKAEADKRRAVELEAEKARVEKAKKDGDYESLVRSAEEAQKAWEQKFKVLDQQIKQKEARQIAQKLALDLNPLDAEAADIIADYVEKRIRYDEEGLKVLDGAGNPSVMGIEGLKEEFKNATKFKPLLLGSKAAGGSATGNMGNVANVKEINRADFDLMPQAKRMEFFKNGGKIKD